MRGAGTIENSKRCIWKCWASVFLYRGAALVRCNTRADSGLYFRNACVMSEERELAELTKGSTPRRDIMVMSRLAARACKNAKTGSPLNKVYVTSVRRVRTANQEIEGGEAAPGEHK